MKTFIFILLLTFILSSSKPDVVARYVDESSQCQRG